MTFWKILSASSVAAALMTAPIMAQEAGTSADAASEEEIPAEDLLTADELETLVAPVALYPDTLLVQIMVAATSPLDVVQADRLVSENSELPPEELKPLVEDQDWDESVEVLAVAFPDVLSDMNDHLDWTQTMGTAMLAQSDDVLDAVQKLRTEAVGNGALVSGEQQTVEVTQEETVIIQPADPQVVYVPQYEPSTVFVERDSDYNVNDALVTGALAFGTFALIDNIFDDDDDWNDYWGCRNCGGWGGRPIIRDPDINLDVDGNVNIGNRVNIDRKDIKNIDKNRVKGEWSPDKSKRIDAQKKISKNRTNNGNTKLAVNKNKRGDGVRNNIAKRDGDRVANTANRPNVNRNNDRANVNRNGDRPKADSTGDRPRADRTGDRKPNASRPSTGSTQAVKRNSGSNKPKIERASATKKPAVKREAARPAPKKKSSGSGLQKSRSGKVDRASSKRGKASRSKGGKKKR